MTRPIGFFWAVFAWTALVTTMPDSPIVDTHLHLWDPQLIHYPWLAENALLNRPYLLEDYRSATDGIPIDSMVFVQCEADFSAFELEAAWVARLAEREPRIKALVAWAPLEKGSAAAEDLERLKNHQILRGIRRIIQFEPDLSFCLRPEFIAGVRLLRQFDLSFDICIDHRHMANILQFAERIPDVTMILDHIGKPAIRDGQMQPWANQMRELAKLPHVVCKISGVATEADHRSWTADDLRRYINVAIEAFGFDRVLFGGDWPVSLQAIGYQTWVRLLDEILASASKSDRLKFWHDNAVQIYRI
jgi:L-fuconolactonase